MSVKKRKKGKIKKKQSLEQRVITRVNQNIKRGITPTENMPLDAVIKDCKGFLKEIIGYHYPLVVLSDFITKQALPAHDLHYDAVKNTLTIARIAEHLSVVDQLEEDIARMETLDIAEELSGIAQEAATAFDGADQIYPHFVKLLHRLADDYSKDENRPVSADDVISIYASGWISELLMKKTDVEVVDDK